jgi:transcription elongation factor Elf1
MADKFECPRCGAENSFTELEHIKAGPQVVGVLRTAQGVEDDIEWRPESKRIACRCGWEGVVPLP